MTELHNNDLHYVVSHLPKDIRDMLESRPVVLGGGFIRELIAGNKPNDIDLFGAVPAELSETARELAKTRECRIFYSANAVTVIAENRMPVQFITRWVFEKPEQVIGSFDFTVCQAVVWFADAQWHSAIGEDFYRDLAARRLTYTHPDRNEDAGGSLLRVRKFLARGYSIQAQSLAGVVARLAMGVRWESPEVGTEAGLTRVITGLLREVDPLSVVDGVEVAEENKEQ